MPTPAFSATREYLHDLFRIPGLRLLLEDPSVEVVVALERVADLLQAAQVLHGHLPEMGEERRVAQLFETLQ